VGRDSDPESDDYGLPRVEIVVPDDARELERDVVAYHREVRQHRRKERWRRLGIPLFIRYGVAAPFIASAVLIALISGVLMTVIAPRQTSRSLPSTAPSAPKAAPGQIGGPLPNVSLSVNGTPTLLTKKIHPGVIAIVPQHCACDQLVKQLAGEATGEQVPVYLVGDGASAKDVHNMYWKAAKGTASTVSDPSDVLATTYHAAGFTAVLVHSDGVVGEVLKNLNPHANLDLAPQLRELSRPGAGAVVVTPS
jgi:hypothetical protein